MLLCAHYSGDLAKAPQAVIAALFTRSEASTTSLHHGLAGLFKTHYLSFHCFSIRSGLRE